MIRIRHGHSLALSGVQEMQKRHHLIHSSDTGRKNRYPE